MAGEALFDVVPAGEPPVDVTRVSDPAAPLAARMRPRSLDEVLGQERALRAGSPLRRLVESGGAGSVILVGPPGTGKTTLAYLLSRRSDDRPDRFVEISAVSSGVKEVREAVDAARRLLARSGRRTVLFVDEIHRFSKTQQDAVLPAAEHGWVTLVAATTENPHFAVVAPLLSRSVLVTLEPLTAEAITTLLQRAANADVGLGGRVVVSEPAADALVRLSGGDARRALTYLDHAAAAAESSAPSPPGSDPIELHVGHVELAVEHAVVRYDRDGDQHYDVTSALIKSIRGSDVDASLHYLARMAEGGEDPRFLARRLVILASEDIGLADPDALATAVAGAQAVGLIGWPEARLVLGQVVIALALAPKSNAVLGAVSAAVADLHRAAPGPVPAHLRDAHYAAARREGVGGAYAYPHDDPLGVARQQYFPDDMVGRQYYQPTDRGHERAMRERYLRLREILHGGEPGSATPDR